jgi:hypothetical protein
MGNKIVNSIIGALVGAFITLIVVGCADVSIFGDKANVFLAALLGVPVGSSIGYTFFFWKQWRGIVKISMVVACTGIGFWFSYAFIYVGIKISEKYVAVLFILQFACVIAITSILGSLMNKSSLTSGSRRA